LLFVIAAADAIPDPAATVAAAALVISFLLDSISVLLLER